jgi:hypothetical protein
MMNLLRKSLSLEIGNFVGHVKSILGVGLFPSFSKSAFVQCRKKIQPEVFQYLNQRLIEEFYTDNEASVKLMQGFRTTQAWFIRDFLLYSTMSVL